MSYMQINKESHKIHEFQHTKLLPDFIIIITYFKDLLSHVNNSIN